MSHLDRSYDRLKLANPHPTGEVEGKPTARQMLAVIEAAETGSPALAERVRTTRPWGRPALIVASFAAAIVLLIPALFVMTQRDDPPAGRTPSTTLSPSTTDAPATTSTTVTTTSVIDNIDPETQALLDTFVEVYNSGDADAFMAFLAEDFRREWTVDRNLGTQPLDTVRTSYEIDAALNTQMTLSCRVEYGVVVCDTLKYDDLNRVLGNPPLAHWTMRLVFENERLVRWAETRYHGNTDYDEQIREFTAWVSETHPEVGELSPFLGQSWVIRPGITSEIAELVDEWAISQGVTLDG